MLNFNQQLAFEKFSKLKVGALFMQMGTGKTRVALELVKYNKVDFLLYVTPFSTIKNIEFEIEKWGINCEYKIIGYETIQSSSSKYLETLELLENKKCFIIADESIFIKNEETKRFERICQLRKKCEYALILNGTPLTKNEWDIYNQMYFLSPLIFKMNRGQFLNTFFKKITYRKRHEKERTFYKFSEVNADVIYKLIEPYIFKCDLEFDKRQQTSFNYINYEDYEYYKEKEKKLEEYKETRSSETIINMLNLLNVISCNYEKKSDAVIKYIANKQVIVFCNFLQEVDYISSKIHCYVIIGNTKNRNEIIKNFEKDKKPLIMTFGVGSYSLNLQFCNEIVYTGLNFDYAKFEQSKYRIKRIGQQSDIKYTYFLTNLGITKFIEDNIDKKRNLKELINQKIMEGKELEWLKNI